MITIVIHRNNIVDSEKEYDYVLKELNNVLPIKECELIHKVLFAGKTKIEFLYGEFINGMRWLTPNIYNTDNKKVSTILSKGATYVNGTEIKDMDDLIKEILFINYEIIRRYKNDNNSNLSKTFC